MFAKLMLRVRGQLIAGFAAECAIIALSFGYAVFAVSGVSTTVNEMVGLRTPVAIASAELAGNTVVFVASEKASANLESVACATEQMSSSVTEIGRQVLDAARIASAAVR
ncbi:MULTISPECIES: hypothetical protein [Bradyrhizobium]|uniref:Uncharacterized protein n=3 Tax=Bradyrhizobium TaxID=374 RepID=A0A410VHN9_9BRAD|nr:MULTISPECIES: hypothetical protein [Bradyrhizobium]MCG2631927.1 hypothetical protein [Bradyrhizobium zhengyangense]MCG2644982.1 hypothetical protein [Bradyrhizobium zhengyangense]MCG2672722.1 hypothetical protein [Bradyrhizobium zhengyangense]MDN4985428.1 hypothetical protein [Bradyrhizobium sp. WYCCWR 13022]MDN5002340.1 hypothetical protein [Bradyrhizobium sp. WYCCWR 12677]